MSTKSTDPNKWLGPEHAWADAKAAVSLACTEFGRECFAWREDVTRREARTEFCERLAEYFGFKIIWQTEVSENQPPTKGGGGE